MTFLFPLGLALAALLPILVLLYLLKVRRRETDVSSTYIWRHLVRDMAAHEPFQRLRLSWLLIAQLLVLTALVLAFARPALPLLAQESVYAVLVVDVSASMQATDVPPSRFAAALVQARQVIEQLPEGSTATIVEAGPRPRVLATDQSDPGESLRALEQLRVGNAASDIAEALRLGEALAGDRPRRQFYLVSDGAYGTQDLPDLHGATLTFLPVGGGADNRAVTAIAARPDPLDGNRVHLFVRVRNYSAAAVSDTLTLSADGGPLEARALQIPANDGVDVVFDKLPRSVRVAEAKLGGADSLAADNSAAVVLGNRPPLKALLISSGNLFLEKLLRIIPGVELYRAEPRRYFALDTSTYDVIVFDNYLPEVLPSVNVLALNPPDNPLFPVQGEVVRPRVTFWDKEHPLLRFVDLREVGIARARVLGAPGWAKALVESEEAPLLWAGEDAGRRVVVFSFDLRQSNLPLSVAFPILMSNVLNYLEPAGSVDVASLSPNQTQTLVPLPQADSVVVTRPDGANVPLTPSQGKPMLFEGTDAIGLYEVTQRQGDETLSSERFAVNLADETESDIRPAAPPPSATASNLAEGPLVTIQREVWLPLAALAGALLVGEWWLYHRRGA